MEDFIGYAQATNINSLSQFLDVAQDLYKLIHIKGLGKQVRVKLDQLNDRSSIAYSKELRSIEDVKADCLRLASLPSNPKAYTRSHPRMSSIK